MPNEYWRAVAKSIDAENEKLSQFVTHPTGLGTAREAILRHFLVTHTPEPFRIDTGFISHFAGTVGSPEAPERWGSKQCDLLVHDPRIAKPFYAIENLVVVPRDAAKAVIEVKSEIDGQAFAQMCDLQADMQWLPVNVLGFAYDGWSFETFVEKLSEAIRNGQYGVPDCIAVHAKNYVFLRTAYRLAPVGDRHRPANYQVAVNFGASSDNNGLSSGCFLDAFLRLLPCEQPDIPLEAYLPLWFNQLELEPDAKRIIDDSGNVSSGALPTA